MSPPYRGGYKSAAGAGTTEWVPACLFLSSAAYAVGLNMSPVCRDFSVDAVPRLFLKNRLTNFLPYVIIITQTRIIIILGGDENGGPQA